MRIIDDPFLCARNTTFKDYYPNNKDILFLKKDERNPLKNVLNPYPIFIKKEDANATNNQVLQNTPFLRGLSHKIEEKVDEVGNQNFCKKFYSAYCDYLSIDIPSYRIIQKYKKSIQEDRISFLLFRVILNVFYKELGKSEKDLFLDFIGDSFTLETFKGSKFRAPLVLGEVIDEHRLYDVGVTLGDGTLTETGNEYSVCDGGKNEQELTNSQEYIKNLVKLKKILWAIKPSQRSIRQRGNWWEFACRNKLYLRFLNFVYDIPFGAKSYITEEPKILELLGYEEQLQKKAILYRGICDADGSPQKAAANFYLTTASSKLKDEFVRYLHDLEMKPSISFTKKQHHTIRVLTRDIHKFTIDVGSSHPRKLRLLLNSLRRETHVRYMGLRSGLISEDGFFKLEKMNYLRIAEAGQHLREYRKTLDLCQKSLAARLGVLSGTYKAWESNSNTIPFSKFKEILNMCGKDNLYKELEERNLTKFAMGGKIVTLPLKPKKNLENIVQHISFHTRIQIILNNPDFLKNFQEIFDVMPTSVRRGIPMINSMIIAEFIRTFYIFERPWEPISAELEQTLSQKYYANFWR